MLYDASIEQHRINEEIMGGLIFFMAHLLVNLKTIFRNGIPKHA